MCVSFVCYLSQCVLQCVIVIFVIGIYASVLISFVLNLHFYNQAVQMFEAGYIPTDSSKQYRCFGKACSFRHLNVESKDMASSLQKVAFVRI